MATTNLNALLARLNESLTHLQTQAAEHTGPFPSELRRQIHNHEKAVSLTQQAIDGKLTQSDWQVAIQPLNLSIENFDVAGHFISGTVIGDITGGDKIGGDQIFGDKIVNLFRGSQTARDQRNRQMMLQLVRDIWIKGVLDASLHGAVLIELGLEMRRDAVAHPWEMVLQTLNQPDEPLPRNARLIDVFDRMGRELLILGEPGSGKTTMLLELARDVIARAQRDPGLPLPVVLNLSSWVDKEQPLAEWLANELAAKYNIPKSVAQLWVNNNDLLLLLDGLDEVAAERREACARAINEFRQQHWTPLAVCSRTADYEALNTRLKLRGAVCLQPLSLEQINDYLKQVGLEQAEMWQSLQNDEELQELVKSPLMLSVMTLAYRGASIEELQMLDSPEARLTRLFDAYAQRMFARRGSGRYTPQQTQRWLAWLARLMRQTGQTEFFIEGLQPASLQRQTHKWWYAIGIRAVGGLAVMLAGLVAAVLGFVLSGWLANELSAAILIQGIAAGLGIALAFGLAFFTASVLAIKLPPWLAVIGAAIITMLPLTLFFPGARAPVAGLIFGLPGALGGILFVAPDAIIVREKLRWSGRKALLGAPIGLLAGLITGLIAGLSDGLQTGINTGLAIGIPIGLTFMLMFSLSRSQQVEVRLTPNQGIRQSLRNAGRVGLIVVGVCVLSGLLIGLLTGELIPGIGFGLIVGLPTGFIIGLAIGGAACIQHAVLRLILHFNRQLPWALTPFLEFARERIFLRRVGGGYIFIHRFLLEYFASLEVPQNSSDRRK